MLLRSVYLHLDGEIIVLAQDVLHRIDVVLTHVGQTAAVVVEVAAEGLVSAVDIVGLVGSRTEPKVVVEFFGNGLHFKVLFANPEELPCKASCARDADRERPSEQAAIDELLQGLNFCAESVEGIFETEPCVQAEDAAVALHSFFHAFAFTDGTCHGFFAEDILPGIGGNDGHQAVPMGWGSDVNDIYIGVVDEFAEVMIGFQLFAPFLLGRSDCRIEVLLVNVAESHETAVLVADKM